MLLFTARTHDSHGFDIRTRAGGPRVVARASAFVARGRARQHERARAGSATGSSSTEVALAVVLVIGAGLMTRSFVKLMQIDLGFARDHRVASNFTLSDARHPTEAEIKDTYAEMLTVCGRCPA